jgi:hypothetical protein
VADAEDSLQSFIHKLERVTSKNDKFSKSKTETVAFKRRDPARSKIIMNNNIIQGDQKVFAPDNSNKIVRCAVNF